jgi:transcriptional regulator with XRE-family HTH domain
MARTTSPDLAANLRAEPARRGLTQAELAEAAKRSRECVSRLECGRHRPRRVTLEAVARVLGVEVSALEREEEKAAPCLPRRPVVGPGR